MPIKAVATPEAREAARRVSAARADALTGNVGVQEMHTDIQRPWLELREWFRATA